MKASARIVIGVVIAMLGTVLLPRPASQVMAPEAKAAQIEIKPGKIKLGQIEVPLPTPTLPPVLPKPKPKPDPKPDPDPVPNP
ncbi:MAG TPA: hypothetical protein VFD47_03135, partial [Actinomycetota bacterium]|nr:hypothetical protein [Actinomycetota bacterium]